MEYRNENESEGSIPVKVGDRCSVRITAKGAKGDGIAKISNYVVIVPDTEVDREYTIEITRALAKFGFGKVVGNVEQQEQQEDNEDFGDN